MKCDQAKTLMHDYISDELDTVSQKELSEHLNGCADCQQELDQLEQYKACMSLFKTPTLEPGRATHLLRRVAQREAMKEYVDSHQDLAALLQEQRQQLQEQRQEQKEAGVSGLFFCNTGIYLC